MTEHTIVAARESEMLSKFEEWLIGEEREKGTIEKYLRDINGFLTWMANKKLCKVSLIEWKNELITRGYKARTVNAMLASVNTYCRFLGNDLRVRYLRIQKTVFEEENRCLDRNDYERLVKTASKNGLKRLEMILETIASTGIRVSEIKYITIDTVRKGRATITLKGKIRTILLPGKLREKLRKYAKQENIHSGEIFRTQNGRGISRKQIWQEMKILARKAGIIPTKVFPHNLRHLFAKTYYQLTKDIVKLADLLGHSSVDTTRIYLLTTESSFTKQLEELHLIL